MSEGEVAILVLVIMSVGGMVAGWASKAKTDR